MFLISLQMRKTIFSFKFKIADTLALSKYLVRIEVDSWGKSSHHVCIAIVGKFKTTNISFVFQQGVVISQQTQYVTQPGQQQMIMTQPACIYPGSQSKISCS